jgi:glutamate decarboxylase
MPANRTDLVVQRILVRHGVSKDLGDLLIKDIKRCLKYFKKNPVTVPLTEKEAGGYKH